MNNKKEKRVMNAGSLDRVDKEVLGKAIDVAEKILEDQIDETDKKIADHNVVRPIKNPKDHVDPIINPSSRTEQREMNKIIKRGQKKYKDIFDGKTLDKKGKRTRNDFIMSLDEYLGFGLDEYHDDPENFELKDLDQMFDLMYDEALAKKYKKMNWTFGLTKQRIIFNLSQYHMTYKEIGCWLQDSKEELRKNDHYRALQKIGNTNIIKQLKYKLITMALYDNDQQALKMLFNKLDWDIHEMDRNASEKGFIIKVIKDKPRYKDKADKLLAEERLAIEKLAKIQKERKAAEKRRDAEAAELKRKAKAPTESNIVNPEDEGAIVDGQEEDES